MKNLFRAIIVIAVGLLATACGQALQVTSSPVPPTSTATTIPLTATPVPSQTATATIEVTPRPEYVPPTLLPTINPALLPSLLNKALSIETMDLNGYKARRITGWDLGLAGNYCGGYYWLDMDHLLIYPVSGEDQWGEGGSRYSIASQPIVVNLDTSAFWAPPFSQSEAPSNCGRVDWSTKLKILITWETRKDVSTVSTYTYEGKKWTSYPGELSSISPSGTKMLIDDNIWVDLKSGKRVEFAWSKPSEEEIYPIYHAIWSSDETQVYTCCYKYGNAQTGESYDFPYNDLSVDGEKTTGSLFHSYGDWVLNDSYLLIRWDFFYDTNPGFIPLFDPKAKTLRDLNTLIEIPDDLGGQPNCQMSFATPNGKYVWAICGSGNYLIDLTTYESVAFPDTDFTYDYPDWSANNEFAWMNTDPRQILSVVDKKLNPLPVSSIPESEYSWHPTDNIVVYPAKDKNALIFLDVATMTYRELPFQAQDSQSKINIQHWSPNGDKLIFTTEGHILWQVDYPSLDNLEQITDLPNKLGGAQFSPDGKSISFISGSDIYIVDTIK